VARTVNVEVIGVNPPFARCDATCENTSGRRCDYPGLHHPYEK